MIRHFHLLPPFIRRFGMIPESYKIAMTYEEQLLWLCKYVEDLGLEIENIKTALTNIENAINDVSGRLDIVASQAQNCMDLLNGAYLITRLNEDKTLTDFKDVINKTGYYYTYNYVVTDDSNLVIPENTLFYYDAFAKRFKIYDGVQNSFFEAYQYNVGEDNWIHSHLTYTTSVNAGSTDYEVPSALSVYEAILEASLGTVTINYETAVNKPTINGVTVEGNLTSSDLQIEGLSILEDDTYNVYNLENGFYLVGDRNTTTLNCGDKTVLLGDGYSLLYIFGSHNFMLISSSDRNGLLAPSEYPLLTSGNCSAENNGTVYQYESNILSCWGIDTDLSDSGNSHYYVPSALAVKNYVNTKVGDIETILNTLNVGSGVE